MVMIGLCASAHAVDLPAIAFGGSAFAAELGTRFGFALLGELPASLLAGFGFPIQHLGDQGRSTDLGQTEHFNFKLAAIVLYAQQVADPDFASGFGLPALALDAAELAGARRERSGLEETRRPQPFVHSDPGAVHALIFVRPARGPAKLAGLAGLRRR